MSLTGNDDMIKEVERRTGMKVISDPGSADLRDLLETMDKAGVPK